MSTDNPFLIGDERGVSPQISGLIGMFRYARKTTLETVAGLSVKDLDHLQDPDSNSIGGLLYHMAAAEAWYQANTFDQREWTAAESARWQVALELGPKARSQIREHPLDYYIALLAEVRAAPKASCASVTTTGLLRAVRSSISLPTTTGSGFTFVRMKSITAGRFGGCVSVCRAWTNGFDA